jgi:phospholipid/cholesterol/gamma-HCH transport system substrate-binding protein
MSGERRRLLPRLRMKSFTERRPKVVGAIAIVVIAVFVVGAITLNSSLFASTYQIAARFPNAVGIGPGAQVLEAGVQVGSVGNVSVQGNSVLVDLNINQGVVLPRDTGAEIDVQTVLGVTAIVLRTGSDWAQPLQPGAVIIDTAAPVEFFDVQSSAGHLLSATDAKALSSLVDSLAAVTTGKQTEVSAIVKGLNRFTGTISARQAQVSQLIDAAESLSGTLASRDQQLAGVVDDLDTVVAGLASHSSELGQLVDNTELAASETASLIGRNHPRIQQLLNALHVDLAVIGQHQLDLAQSVSYAGAAVNGFSSVGYSGSTPNGWANIYVNLLSATSALTVLGACGALDDALDLALGPDPLPCSEQTGALPTSSTSPSTSTSRPPSSPAGGKSSGGGSKTSSTRPAKPSSGSTGTPTLPGIPSLTSGGDPLQTLLGPLTSAPGGGS